MRPVDTANSRAAMFILCNSWISINQCWVFPSVDGWTSNLEEKLGSIRNAELRNRVSFPQARHSNVCSFCSRVSKQGSEDQNDRNVRGWRWPSDRSCKVGKESGKRSRRFRKSTYISQTCNLQASLASNKRSFKKAGQLRAKSYNHAPSLRTADRHLDSYLPQVASSKSARVREHGSGSYRPPCASTADSRSVRGRSMPVASCRCDRDT